MSLSEENARIVCEATITCCAPGLTDQVSRQSWHKPGPSSGRRRVIGGLPQALEPQAA